MRHAALILALSALPALIGPVRTSHDTSGPRVDERGLEKLDPAVRAAVDSGRTAQVIVLGRTQLFEPVGGLEAFEARNANRDRRALRAEVVSQLRKTASVEQRAILARLGKPSAMRALLP